MPRVSFEDKVAWVTGASSGIGEALSHALANRGAVVVLSARREDVLRRVQSACHQSERHLVVPLDLNDLTTVKTAADRVEERFGHVDILINNAGLSQRAVALDTDLSVDRQIMDVNYFGPVALTKRILPTMIDRGGGQIVVVSSLLGKFGVGSRSAYAASKHALHGFFDSLRAEVYQSGIRVTLACPGFVQTNASINALMGDGTPQGKMDENLQNGLSPEYCADKILRAVERCRREIYLGRHEKMALYLSRFAPGLFHRLMRKTRLK